MSDESNGKKIDTALPEKKVKRQPLPSLCSHGKKRLYTCRLCHLDARKAGIIRPSAFCDLHDERKSRCKACTPGVSNDATTDEIDATPKKRAKIQEDPIFAPCPHGKKKRNCKECGGSRFCIHEKQKTQCRECGGSSFCAHGRRKSNCKECGGASICIHSREKSKCKDCGGGSVCSHGKLRIICKDCGGSHICSHNRRKSECKDCGGSQVCSHGRQKSACKDCGGSQICSHGRQKSACKDCRGSQICSHGRQKPKCKDCRGSQICSHGRHKPKCKYCKEQPIDSTTETEAPIQVIQPQSVAVVQADVGCVRLFCHNQGCETVIDTSSDSLLCNECMKTPLIQDNVDGIVSESMSEH